MWSEFLLDNSSVFLIKDHHLLRMRRAGVWTRGLKQSTENCSPLGKWMDFPGGSDGKLSVYNARDLDLIPGENEYEMPRNLLDSSCRYCVQSLQSCLTLCDPMDYSPPGSSVDGILQVRILEWAASSFSRGYSWSRDQTWVSNIAGRFFTIWAFRETCG